MSPYEGTTLQNRYRIDGLLAQGGMGAIYVGFDTNLQIRVAIKENYFRTPAATEQFKREALILARLRHPGLPRVLEHFAHEGQQYLVMEFIAGPNLWDLIEQRNGPVTETEALTWINSVCDAVAYLHHQSPPILHRDIKPQNIKITPGGQVVLVDLGLVKEGSVEVLTATGAQGVTPGFSPPEQYGGTTSPASDIYALGATLYALLTGTKPPDSISLAVGEAEYIPPERFNPAIRPAVSQAIAWAMQPRPADRPQTVEAWRGKLPPPAMYPLPLPKDALATAASSADRTPTMLAPPPRRHLPAWVWAVMGAAGAALILGLILLVGPMRYPGHGTPTFPTPIGVTRTAKTTEPKASLIPLAPTAAVLTATPAPTHPPATELPARPTPTPTALPTSVPTPRPQPSPTPPPTPVPIPTNIPTPTCLPGAGPFAAVWQAQQSTLGCATSDVVTSWMAVEHMERGEMLWREDNATVMALYNNGTWASYPDTWKEGDPEYSCPEIAPSNCPPTPRRGFGQVWCSYSQVRDGLGWATDYEQGFQSQVQRFQNGFLVRDAGGRVVMFLNNGAWSRY